MSKRAYKYRFYPTDEQAKNLAQTFGCVRFLYNFGLHTRSVAYQEQGKKLNYKNHCLAKSISDVGWGEFVRQLDYKAQWYGRTLVKIDRWYPSSKTCHNCKHLLEELDLEVRTWQCPACHALHEGDTNAARNILAEGLSVTACGGSVRPVRAKVRRTTPTEAGKSQS